MKITLDTFIQICTYFTVVCVAIGWMIKIIKGAKKPADDVNKKLDNDNKRLKRLEDSFEYLTGSSTLTMKTLLLILDELKVNNDSEGHIKKAQDDIRNFILERK